MVSSSFRIRAFAFTLICSLVGAPSLAQPQALVIAADRDFEHQWTQMEFPARVGEFVRDEVMQFEERQTNISARYLEPDTGSILSLYIYRPGNPDPAIWFDRALISIGIPDNYGSVDLDDLKIGSFTPSGGTAESGLYAVLEVDGQFRSTAVAIYRVGDWLVKVRLSSRQLSVTRMDRLLRETLEQLPAMAEVDSRPAYYVAQCERRLSYNAAEPLDVDVEVALRLSTFAGIVPVATPENTAGPATTTYCREGERSREYNIFRPEGTNDRYTVAIGDAGFSYEVYPAAFSILSAGEAEPQRIFVVQSATGLEMRYHIPFESLPNLRQSSASVFEGPVIVSSSRRLAEDEDPQINISVPMPPTQ